MSSILQTTSISRVGFFHFGSDEKRDPVGSLEIELNKGPELADSLIVLPEAFDARGGYYNLPVKLDDAARARLQALSLNRGIAFVVSLIERVKGYNSAYLINGTGTPSLLSRKRSGGRACLYRPCPTGQRVAILCRGIAITAFVCEDSIWTEDKERSIRSEIEKLGSRRIVLCIPACMDMTDSLDRAKRWAKASTVVVANGLYNQPSVILHDGYELTSDTHLTGNQIKLCNL